MAAVRIRKVQLLYLSGKLQAADPDLALAEFVTRFQRLGEQALGASPEAFQVGVEVVCDPSHTRFRVLGDDAPAELVAAYTRRLDADLEYLQVCEGQVHLLVLLAVQP